MAFAIVDIAGFQEKVTPGAILRVPKLSGKIGDTVTFERVLLHASNATIRVGTPYIAGLTMEAKIIAKGKREKIRVSTMRRRKRERHTQGHRQGYTEIAVTKI